MYEWQGGAATQYYQGPTGPLALRRTGHGGDDGVFYMLSDHLGSTSALVAQNGALSSTNYYHPYGDARGGPFSTLTTKRYMGPGRFRFLKTMDDGSANATIVEQTLHSKRKDK